MKLQSLAMKYVWVFFLGLMLLQGCTQKNSNLSKEVIDEMNLKRGQIITCGTPDLQFGSAEFKTACCDASKADFNLAVKLLHSFEYDEAEKAFAKVVDTDPDCAMAWWGIAMSNFHPLWSPPSPEELKKGARAVQVAQSLQTSPRETAYIEAIAAFYTDWETTDHRTRCLRFEKGMENVYSQYAEDKESVVFYTLALNAAADPTDKSFTKQKKAGALLQSLYPGQPNHPGIVHYLIHSYDSPELARQGLPAARHYATIAPSSAHALHMPSHIFTRLGLWDEGIRSNAASVASAQCYAEATGIKGHWDEEMHGLDYLMYAYLQKGDNDSAKIQLDYVKTIAHVEPVNFKVAYAFAAIPSRYVLENRLWKEAASLPVSPDFIPWKKFPWQQAIVHFARALGSVHTGKPVEARRELAQLHRLQDTLLSQKDAYKANQVAIQIRSAEAWILLSEGKNREALDAMQQAAAMEDSTEKHPVTPCEVLPAQELLADMLLQLNQPEQALKAYQADLQKRPNRFNALYGAGLAAEKAGQTQLAKTYFQQLLQIVGTARSNRPEILQSSQRLKAIAAR